MIRFKLGQGCFRFRVRTLDAVRAIANFSRNWYGALAERAGL
jgi:hypothetical protein